MVAGCRDGSGRAEAVAWADVEASAAPLRTYGPTDELLNASALVLELDGGISLDPTDLDQAARLRDELPEAAREAVAALVRWDQGGGGLPPLDCGTSDTARAAVRLSQAALVLAGDEPDAPALHATARLAFRLRVEGPTMLEGVVAARIADNLRAWAVARERAPGEAARLYQPTEDELVRLVAAEGLCTLEVTAHPELLLGGEPPDPDGLAVVLARMGPPMRRYWIDLLALLRARPDDPDAVDERIVARTDAAVRALDPVPPGIANAPRLIERVRGYDDAYRDWLANAAAPAP